jgi:RHS repeat-associated protein
MAYGEEISRPNYGSDSVRQKYTGYEKDSETDLDFAQARMYVSKLGRFSTVDPLMASASAINPQTFNRYSYVINSPYKLIDPSGLAPEGKSGSRATPMEDWGFGLWGNDDAEARYEKDLARTREDIKDAKDAQTALDSGDWDTFFTIMGRNKDLAEANAALIENLLTRQTQDPLEELFALVNEIFGNGAVVPLPSEDNLKRWVQITQENKNMVGLLKLGVFLFYRSGLLNDDEKNNPLSGLDEKGMKNYIFKLASVFSQYVLSNVESMQLGYYQAREFDIVNNKPKDGTEQHLRYKQDFLVNRFTYIFERSWQRGLLENKKSKEPKTPN